MPIVNPDELLRALYEVNDTIQHDWTRGPAELEPHVRSNLIVRLKATANEISALVSRIEVTDV